MPEHHLGFISSDGTKRNVVPERARQSDATRSDVGYASGNESGELAAADREQLEREFAAIERASAALRRAEPALESWTESAGGNATQAAAGLAAYQRAVAFDGAGHPRRGLRHCCAGRLIAKLKHAGRACPPATLSQDVDARRIGERSDAVSLNGYRRA